MQWFQTLDVSLFRFINGKLANPVFDVLMPFASGNVFFYPLLALLSVTLIWKGRTRGLVCVLLLALLLPLGDSWICRTIKRAVGRPRPFVTLTEVHRPGVPASHSPSAPPPAIQPKKDSAPATGSMPSSHAANWFAATLIAFVYYRRTLWFMLPAAILVSFSRIYNGVHYPSDVLAGAILGAGYAAASIWCLQAIWDWAGRKWFPLWWQKIPSLILLANPTDNPSEVEPELPPRRFIIRGQGSLQAIAPPKRVTPHVDVDAHWLRLGYVIIALLLFARLIYIGGDKIQLTGDEAYQWLWSKHLALSYYSKPPLIAYAQFLSTSLFGDTGFGVRFFAPVSAAVLSLLLLRFFAREFNARAGFFLLLIVTATPLASAGAVLMTVDALSVLFWGAAMVAGWRAVQPNATTRSWAWVGLWMGLGFLSKYTALFQWLCWAVFFLLWPPARRQWRRPGPYLALLINGFCALPVLIWNYQNKWVTVGHVAGDAKVGQPWSPTLKYFWDFLGSEALLLNPIFFVAMIWAATAFWRRARHNPKLIYLFSMGAPLFVVYLLYTFHSRVLPNWIAPSVLPLFCLMVAYWDIQWRLGPKLLKPALIAGLGLGLPLVVIGHDTELIGKFTGHLLPVNQDPLHRARGWKEVAQVAARARQELLAEGKPVFIIAGHYRLAGELSFYLGQSGAGDIATPLVYCRSTAAPVDQFYFWPGYNARKGENAIFIMELDRDDPQSKPAPAQVCQEFESVTDLGFRAVLDHGRVLWRLQLFACRSLR
jgi:membrane-associated phospholipid phosphatase